MRHDQIGVTLAGLPAFIALALHCWQMDRFADAQFQCAALCAYGFLEKVISRADNSYRQNRNLRPFDDKSNTGAISSGLPECRMFKTVSNETLSKSPR
jgi:hypothetical protein